MVEKKSTRKHTKTWARGESWPCFSLGKKSDGTAKETIFVRWRRPKEGVWVADQIMGPRRIGLRFFSFHDQKCFFFSWRSFSFKRKRGPCETDVLPLDYGPFSRIGWIEI